MPPTLPRKRPQPDSPPSEPPPKRTAHPRRKEPAFDAPPAVPRTLSQKQRQLEEFIGGDDDDDLSSRDSSEDEFEDVPIANANDSDDESEDEEWEDALGTKHHTKQEAEPEREPVISGDLQFTMNEPPEITYTEQSGKKGPSKRDRQIRNSTHCMHVQFLMFHNLMRNAWVCDKEVQNIMLGHLNVGCWKAINRYWRDAGISDGPTRVVEGGWTDKIANDIGKTGAWIQSGTKGVQIYESPQKSAKGKGTKPKTSSSKGKGKAAANDRNARDWGATSERLEPNTPNLSAGDPLPRLMNYLAMYWKSKYRITAPSLRKRGYLSLANLAAETRAWHDHKSDAKAFGERLENIQDFKQLARNCQGSRDVGQQLFTSLIRGLGIEARMVASLQPVGFKFTKSEEGKPKDLSNLGNDATAPQVNGKNSTSKKASNSRANGGKDDPIDLSDSELSSAISIASGDEEEPGSKDPENAPAWQDRFYGRVIPYPTYWTEAISNLTHTPVAISMLPKITLATPADQKYYLFESTPANAERGHQVFAYLIAFSSDGTAKDVTTRYLRNRRWPGVTKGFRLPVEKVTIHNKKGKVKRFEEWDWFKSVLRPYTRAHAKRQPWDEVEDEGDLVSARPIKPKTLDEGAKETLQGYKNSEKFVLERHLRREEVIKPGAKILRHFTTGKGDNEKQEPVYRREDVVTCKSVESWHKEGRAVKEGEQPLKFVPMRVVTTQRKREIEEREREEGQKIMQGLYSEAQTDWIIPDPIVDGKIPRNAFGNIDVYVPTMIPKGAIHIPLKGTVRICKKLNIDYAEACTGFEFGNKRAVPVITGVVVAVENEDLVMDAWEAAEADKAKKEEDKRLKHRLYLWKKFYTGLRIIERVKRSHEFDALEIWERDKKALEPEPEPEPEPESDSESRQPKAQSEWDTFRNHSGSFEGGFIRDDDTGAAGGFVPDDKITSGKDEDMAGGFMPESPGATQGGFLLTIDGEIPDAPSHSRTETAYQTPVSLHALHQKSHTEVSQQGDEYPNPDHDMEAESSSDEVPTSRRTRNPPSRKPISDSEDASSLSDAAPLATPDSDEDMPPRSTIKRKASPASPATAPARSAPKRTAARRSSARVKSHFFAGSDEETDAVDNDNSPVKVKAGGRGRGGGRGRARGRGRGRGKTG